jgi:ferrous-iron efflux pump FieF
VVRRTGSQAIAADSLHYRTDLLVNLAVLTALLATNPLGLLWLDPLIGGMIALYLLTAALRIGRRAIGTLMDHELGPAERERIKAIINGHPEVRGLHDLRTREAAGVRFIECHIELDGALTIDAAHVITDTLEGELTAAFPDAEIIIHPEPAGLEDARLDDRIRAGADAAAARRRFG